MLSEAISSVNDNFKYGAYLDALKSINPAVEKFFADVLVNDKGRRLVARFDCRRCEMTISLIENEAQLKALFAESGISSELLSQTSGHLR